MRIRVNEKAVRLETPATLLQLKQKYAPKADLVIYNAAVIPPARLGDVRVEEGGAAVFIRRGKMPSKREMETLMAARHTPGVHAKLKKAVVGIAGAGGLGSNAALALARIGAGKLIIADYDVVEPSNLNRQAYEVSQIGKMKVLALKENIRKINPYVEVDARQIMLDEKNVCRCFGGADIVIEAFDTPQAKAMLAKAWAARYPARPLIMASGLAGFAPAGLMQTKKLAKNVYVVGDMASAAEIGRGLMAPRVGIAANMQANLALRLILGLPWDDGKKTKENKYD